MEGSLTEARHESFQDQQTRLNARLCPVMRIGGNFYSGGCRYADYYQGERGYSGGHSCLYPEVAEDRKIAQENVKDIGSEEHWRFGDHRGHENRRT